MDPNVTWNDLLAALTDGEWETAQDRAHTLLDWLDRDGFPPSAIAGVDVGIPWDRALAHAGCQCALSIARMELHADRHDQEGNGHAP